MVYDWFNRTGPSPADPSATAPPASEQVSDQAPAQPVESSSDPNAEALEWARQAYARLKAQQEEQKRLQLESESAIEPPLQDSVQPVQINTQQPEQGLEQDLQQVAQTATPVAAPLSLLEQAAAQWGRFVSPPDLPVALGHCEQLPPNQTILCHFPELMLPPSAILNLADYWTKYCR